METHQTPKRRPGSSTTPDAINNLPDECIIIIFSFLIRTRDRCSCSAVSRRWFRLQASMLKSDFQLHYHLPPTHQVSRHLVDASDLRLAAMVIGIGSNEDLTHLSLMGSLSSRHRLTNKGVSVVSRVCNKLKSIAISNCFGIGSEGVSAIAYNCGALEKLELTNSLLITDDDLVLVATNCPNLSSLSLDACPLIGNKSLHAVARCSTRLKSLALASCPSIQDSGIVSVVAHRPELSKLKIACMKVGDVVLKAIAHYRRSIKTLHLESICGVTAEGYLWLGAVKGLTNLALISCAGATDLAVDSLTNSSFAGLKSLVIKNYATLTEVGLITMTALTQELESLHLDAFNESISDGGLMEVIANCGRTLRLLTLARCRFYKGGKYESNDRILHEQCQLQRVRLDRCSGINVDEFLASLGKTCRNLQEISLLGLDSVTDLGIGHLMDQLRGNNRITRVDLTESTRIGDRTVWAITRECGARLRTLCLSGCTRVTDRGFGVIGTRCPNLVGLDVSRTGIGDKGVRRLAESDPTNLEEISLAGCGRITDRSLTAIEMSMMPSLERVNLVGCTGLSRYGLDWFRSQGYLID